MTFKPGDRVAVYQAKRYVCEVLEVKEDGTLRVTNKSDPSDYFFAHPKQCRRLVKRERRKWSGEWRNLRNLNNSESVVFVPLMPKADLFDLLGKSMEVIEVRKRKGCDHRWVDSGTTKSGYRCKHCGLDKEGKP